MSVPVDTPQRHPTPVMPGLGFARCFLSLGLILTGLVFTGLISTGRTQAETTGALESRDPTASVDTRIYVSPNRVRVTLEEYTDDLIWLHGMEANKDGLFEADELKRYYDLHRKFLAENFELIRADGTSLQASLVDEGPYPFEDELLKSGATEFHLVKRKMSFTYEYASDKELDVITIRHKIVDENFLYPAELSIQLFQGTSDLAIKSKLRVDTPSTIAFDWENPIPSLSASPEEISTWMDAQQKRMLGVTEFGSVYCWGYIEPRHLRVELLFPLNVLETMFEIESEDPDFLVATELPAVSEKIKAYFAVGNPVTIDQKQVPPQVVKVDYFPANQRDFAIRAKVEKLSFANGRVGITVHYPYRKVPQSIELKWDKFSRALNTVQAYLYFNDSVVSESFSRQVSDNRISWKNPGQWEEPAPVRPLTVQPAQIAPGSRLVWVAAGGFGLLAGAIALLLPVRRLPQAIASVVIIVTVSSLTIYFWPSALPTVNPDAGTDIAEKSIDHIYHSFKFADQQQIYDQLSVSVAGPQRRDLYLQLLEGLTAEEQGGAVSSIEQVRVVAVQLPADPTLSRQQLNQIMTNKPTAAFRCQVQWNLKGLVEHWGHSHERTNQYQAQAWFAALDNQWKLVQLQVESQQPGLTKPRPRKFVPVTDQTDPS